MDSVTLQGISQIWYLSNGRLVPAGIPVKKSPSKLTYYPFSKNPSDKSNGLKIGGDKEQQKQDTLTKEKEISSALHQSLKHISDSPITESMRVVQLDYFKQSGIISFSGHAGDWFQPRSPEDITFTLGREINDSSPAIPLSPVPSRKIVSIDKLLAKAEKTLRRNGSVLISGGRGAGKTAALLELSNRMNIHLLRISLPNEF